MINDKCYRKLLIEKKRKMQTELTNSLFMQPNGKTQVINAESNSTQCVFSVHVIVKLGIISNKLMFKHHEIVYHNRCDNSLSFVTLVFIVF